MATIEELRLQRESLISQLSQAKSVRHGDKAVENRSIEEIRESIRVIDAEMGALDPSGIPGKRRRQIRFYTNRGL